MNTQNEFVYRNGDTVEHQGWIVCWQADSDTGFIETAEGMYIDFTTCINSKARVVEIATVSDPIPRKAAVMLRCLGVHVHNSLIEQDGLSNDPYYE